MPKTSEDKVSRILTATLTVLSKKGYENATINEVADEAGVSRGLLHYYFKDKEDLAAKALTFGFGSLWESSIASLSSARSKEQLADTMIDVLAKNIQEKPDFSALLFEMWVTSRRSQKIHKVFSDGLEETVDRLKKLLQLANSAGMVKIKLDDIEGVVRVLLATYNGMAIQLLTNPEKARDKKLWTPVKKMLISALDSS